MSYTFGIPEISPEIPPGTNILIIGDLFSGKDIFSKKFVIDGLNNNEACIFISTNETVDKILTDLKDSPLDNLGIINCISIQSGVSVEIPFQDQIYYVDSPADLTMIMAAINELLDLFRITKKINKIRIILDSTSTLLMYSNLRTIFKFLHVLTNTIKSTDAISLIVMEEGAHEKIEIKAIQQLTQSIIKMEEGKIQIKGLTNLQFEYKIQNNHIILPNIDDTGKIAK